MSLTASDIDDCRLSSRICNSLRPSVAIQAGFYDQSHLTRWFVRQFGVTPSRYVVGAR